MQEIPTRGSQELQGSQCLASEVFLERGQHCNEESDWDSLGHMATSELVPWLAGPELQKCQI